MAWRIARGKMGRGEHQGAANSGQWTFYRSSISKAQVAARGGLQAKGLGSPLRSPLSLRVRRILFVR